MQAMVQKLIDKGHEVRKRLNSKRNLLLQVTFATSYILTKNPGVINVEVPAPPFNDLHQTYSCLRSAQIFEIGLKRRALHICSVERFIHPSHKLAPVN